MMKVIANDRTITGVQGMTESPAATPHTLKKLREAAGMTQTQVAEKMGTTRSRISHIEAKYPGVRHDSLLRYMQAIGARIQIRVGPLHLGIDEISTDESLAGTRAYLEKVSEDGRARQNPINMSRTKSAGAKELVLQTGETEPGDDDTGGHVDHADAQGDQGDGQQSEET